MNRIFERWTSSKLADKIRGTVKPYALGWDEWEKWEAEAAKKHPIRYWIADTFLGACQDIVEWPIKKVYDVRYYINNRFVTKSHVLSSPEFKPGTWQELDDRMIYCLFDSFCDFVETEGAWMNVAFYDAKHRKLAGVPRFRWWKRNSWRSREHGLAWLDFQAEHNSHGTPWAIEAKDLYCWWRDVRPKRLDPHEASGWSAAHRDKDGKFTRKLQGDVPADVLLDRLDEIEKRYYQEDTDNLNRLIRIRKYLWT